MFNKIVKMSFFSVSYLSILLSEKKHSFALICSDLSNLYKKKMFNKIVKM